MTRSDSINELAAALALAQAEMPHAKKDSENPFFKSRYADLAAIWDACRPALTKHGLSIMQSPRLVSVGEAVWLLEVETMLLHSSGQMVTDVLAVPVTPTSAQVVGSAITYARRYALAAFVGVAPEEDDDANAASGVHDRQVHEDPHPPTTKQPSLTVMSVTVKVVKIVKRPLKDDPVRQKFVITGDDKEQYHTFSLTIATTAKAAQEAGAPVQIVYAESKFGRQIQTLREVETHHGYDAPIPADEEPPL